MKLVCERLGSRGKSQPCGIDEGRFIAAVRHCHDMPPSPNAGAQYTQVPFLDTAARLLEALGAAPRHVACGRQLFNIPG